MAQAKNKNTRRKTTKRKTTKSKTKKPLAPLVKVAIGASIILGCVVSLLKMGVIGTFLYQFISLFIGYLTPFLLVFTIVYILYIFFTKQDNLPARTWVGGFFVVSGILLFLAAGEVKPDPVWEGIQNLYKNFIPILTNEQSTHAGLIGLLLLGITGMFFNYFGAYAFSVVFILIGIVLIGFDYFNEKVENREPVEIPKPNLSKVVEHFQREEEPVQDELDTEPESIFIDYEEKKSKKKKNQSIFIKADDSNEDLSNTKYNFIDMYESSEMLSSPSDFRFIDVDDIYRKQKNRKSKPKMTSKSSNFGFIDADKDSQSVNVKPVPIIESQPEESLEMEELIEPVKPKIIKTEEVKTTEPQHYVDYHDEHYENYKMPKLNLLDEVSRKNKNNSNAQNAREQGQKLISILQQFGVQAKLIEIHVGPSVTKFEIKPELGVRVSKISGLQDDIKMALAAKDIRIEAPIPGKNAVGVEIPNAEKTTVQMKDLMRNVPVSLKEHKLVFCIGKDLTGNNCYGELNRMPHLLIAGATGSGKSVCVNSIISSILMRTRPDEVKLVLIDPKKVEFTPYNDVPHLLAPVITDGDMANKALKVVVAMMDRRYDLFTEMGVRNITAYNNYVENHPDDNLRPMTSIVVIIDELADLMLVSAKEVEASIQRITQLARAAGIHLIVATQRPSVDVITGVIKANIPSRIAFAVSSAVDSRTILDQAGAERLLGNGDMLYLPNGETSPKRIQGVFITDDEVNRIAEYVKSQGRPQYDDSFVQLRSLQSQGGEVKPENADPLYPEVKNFVIQTRKASTSLIQRRFSVGYSRAARLIDVLESEGIIGPANGSKPREILVGNKPEGME